MNKRVSDGEVVKRLLKAIDGLVLSVGAMFVTLNNLTHFDLAVPATAGSYALLIAFSCLIVMRGFDIYESRN